MKYQVIVGNIGTVTDTNNRREALKDFNEYVELSQAGYGRASHEAVTLFEDDEPIKEHFAN